MYILCMTFDGNFTCTYMHTDIIHVQSNRRCTPYDACLTSYIIMSHLRTPAGALCEDSCEQLAYVAAFTVSSYANLTQRTSKPFNPLLGETYEFDRLDDLGWRSVAEQVRTCVRVCMRVRATQR